MASEEISAAFLLGVLGWGGASASALELKGKARLACLAASMSIFIWGLADPGELDSVEYRAALKRSFKMRVGRYYMATAGRRILDGTEIRERYKEILRKLESEPDKPAAAIILVVETLKALGPVEVTGQGLFDTLAVVLPPEGKRYLAPFLERVDSIRSDGKGRIQFVLSESSDPEQSVVIPRAPQEHEIAHKFKVKENFTIAISQKMGRTEFRIEPQRIVKAGFLEINETHVTPIEVLDVKLFIDAHLLAFIIDNHIDRVVLRVRAQGSIGPVREQTVQVVHK